MVRPTGGPANSGLGADILLRSKPFYQKLLTHDSATVAQEFETEKGPPEAGKGLRGK